MSRRITVVKNKTELDAAFKNKDIVLIPTIEGISSLFGPINWTYYNSRDCINQNSECYNELVNNIREVKRMEYVPFLIGPAHLAWNRVASQAKAFDSKPKTRKLLAVNALSIKFRETVFNKHSQGIVDTIYDYSGGTNDNCLCGRVPQPNIPAIGRRILDELISDKNGKPILIDMRHMDIQARLDYIDLVEEIKVKEGRKIPIVISHTAVSGKSAAQAKFFGDCPILDRYKELIKPIKFYNSFSECITRLKIPPINIDIVGWFHPWSINVFNEEIEAVYKTEGILGITMEERVLGTGAHNYNNKSYKRDLVRFLKNRGFSDDQIKSFEIAEPLMRNILYIVEHSGFAGKMKSWDHIAIGSDFDGVINPIDVCPTVADIPRLYQLLVLCLPAIADFTGKTNLLCGMHNQVEVLLNKLFYQNGERFILNNYK